MSPSKVAVAFVGTGNYIDFLPKWLSSCEEYLLPSVQKKYLIFTDAPINDAIQIDSDTWPLAALYKYKYINSAYADIYPDCDWFIFIDADMEIVSTILPEDLLPPDKTFFGVHHPCYFYPDPATNKMLNPLTSLEIRPDSLAGVDPGSDPKVYYQSCLWGGRLPQAIEMSQELEARIEDDLSRGVTAKWYDESHLNKYYQEHSAQVHTLHPIFAYPQGFPPPTPRTPKIIHIEKDLARYRP